MGHEHEHEQKTICNIQLKGDTMSQSTRSEANPSEAYINTSRVNGRMICLYFLPDCEYWR